MDPVTFISLFLAAAVVLLVCAGVREYQNVVSQLRDLSAGYSELDARQALLEGDVYRRYQTRKVG